MRKHMVRLMIEPPKGEAETAVNNWVANHNEWENDPATLSLRETTVGVDSGTVYISGYYSFHQEETPTELLDALTSRLESIQGGLWYRIGYHDCTHDEPDGELCSSDRVEEPDDASIIPDDIPELKR